MSSDAGFITNAAAVAGIDTDYELAEVITLAESEAADAGSLHGKLPPAGCIWSHLQLVVDETSATVGTLEAYLTWDAAGDQIAAGPSQTATTVTAGLTDTSLRMCVIPLDNICPSMPAAGAAGTLYLFLKADAGEFTVPIGGAKLHWYDPNVNG